MALRSTYSTVHRDYEGATVEEAAGKMLRDPDIFAQWDGLRSDGHPPVTDRTGLTPTAAGAHTHYMVESWVWDEVKHVLRVWFA